MFFLFMTKLLFLVYKQGIQIIRNCECLGEKQIYLASPEYSGILPQNRGSAVQLLFFIFAERSAFGFMRERRT